MELRSGKTRSFAKSAWLWERSRHGPHTLKMSLYQYRVVVTGGRVRAGRITARSEAEARKQVAKQWPVVDWHSLEEVPLASKPDASRQRPLSKLQKMLYLQSGRCFFCGEPLAEAEASIEHLNPKSKGGTSTEDNEVVCHATLNATFGGMDLRRKFEFVLKSAGRFRCPSP